MAEETPMSADLSALPVIDVDSHWTEPPDLWTSRAPASLKDRALRVQRTDQGVEHCKCTPVSPIRMPRMKQVSLR